ncbi:TlpA family protein disulfide reductase [Parapedobacter koreensis]|uniref:Cytochrome oxidase Cu insertion factor, SCO1/SenC/PrrC family n=1 Tax=Parapedobacter koreensis TaxID=332977 RepID=A0A1H7FFS9_9SPHI|nr:TlpA disulfide reductase family protein [Parapedobacter koreensis]SEK24107.1 Cytochrome oxidase Cu insertion factor, SCO1/SenC/PrrC family [Parapedobacter koreensis]
MAKLALFPIILIILAIEAKTGFSTELFSNRVTITVNFEEKEYLQDTFVLRYWNSLLGVSVAEYLPYEESFALNDSGSFKFTINPQNDFGYFCLSKKEQGTDKSLLYYYLFEHGDDITITMKKRDALLPKAYAKRNREYFSGFKNFSEYTPEFKGRGFAKYQCRFRMDSLSYVSEDSGILTSDYGFFKGNSHDKIKDACLEILYDYRHELSTLAYSLLKSDIYGKQELDKYWEFKWLVLSDSTMENGFPKLKEIFTEGFSPLNDDLLLQNIQFHSPFYLESLIEYHKNLLLIQGLKKPESLYDSISNKYSAIERERLLCLLLLTYRDKFENQFAFYDEIYSGVTDDGLKGILKNYSLKFLKGSSAFPFKFTDLEGHEIELGDLKGQVLLIDFWFTGCRGCITYFQNTLSHVEQSFRYNDKIKFLSVSIDKNVNTWIKSVNSALYSSKETINVFTNGEGTLHEFVKYYNINIYPTILIIDSKGNLVGIYNDRPPKDQLISILNSVE